MVCLSFLRVLMVGTNPVLFLFAFRKILKEKCSGDDVYDMMISNLNEIFSWTLVWHVSKIIIMMFSFSVTHFLKYENWPLFLFYIRSNTFPLMSYFSCVHMGELLRHWYGITLWWLSQPLDLKGWSSILHCVAWAMGRNGSRQTCFSSTCCLNGAQE